MHVTEFIAKVESVFQRLQSPDMHLFIPVDEDLNVVSEKSNDLVTSLKFTFARSQAGSATQAGPVTPVCHADTPFERFEKLHADWKELCAALETVSRLKGLIVR